MRIVALLSAVLLAAGCAAPGTTTVAPEPSAALPVSVGAALQTALDANRDRLGYPGAMVGVWTPVYRANLLEPLGMSQTSFPGSSPELPQPHLDGLTNQPDGTVRDATSWNPSWTFTAGGMISTLDDMHTWTVALGTGDGLISQEMQHQREASTTSRVPPNDAELTYALGFFVDRGWWGHNGALPGFTSYAVHHPQRRTSVVVFVNSDITTPDQQTKPADLLAADIIAALPS